MCGGDGGWDDCAGTGAYCVGSLGRARWLFGMRPRLWLMFLPSLRMHWVGFLSGHAG